MFTNFLQVQAKSCESSNTPSMIRRESRGPLFSLQPLETYICARCSKGFPSSQALGGHQNAHKRERNEERKQMLEDHGRMILLEEHTRMISMMEEMIENYNTPVLYPHPLRAVFPTGEDMTLLVQIPTPNQGNNFMMNPETLLAFHSRNGQAGGTFMPGSGFDPSALGTNNKGAYHQIPHRVPDHHENFINNESYDQIPFGVPLIANDNNHYPAYPTVNDEKLRPWDQVGMHQPVTSFDQSVAWSWRESSRAAVADASIGDFLIKRQERNEVTFNEELDLTLRL